MLAALASWLASKGVSLLLGFLAHLILDSWNSYQANQAQVALGNAESVNAGLQAATKDQATAAAVVNEAASAHAASDDDSAFDQDFVRKA